MTSKSSSGNKKEEISGRLLCNGEERVLAASRVAPVGENVIDETETTIRDYSFLQGSSSPPWSPESSHDRNPPLQCSTANSLEALQGRIARPKPDNSALVVAGQTCTSPPSQPHTLSGIVHIAEDETPANSLVARSTFQDLDQTNGSSETPPSLGPSYKSSSTANARHSVAGIEPNSDTHTAPFSLGKACSGDISVLPEPPSPVSESERLRLISFYLRGTGTWCETTDSDRHFTVFSIQEMMKSSAFVAAAMSLASRHLDHLQRRQRSVTLELYQHTIRLLLRQDPAHADSSILATCTLLCVYEMMASGVDEWRRHLKGCAGLLQLKKWNGCSPGIVKPCFWAFARIDVWAAFVTRKMTLIPAHFWMNDISLESLAAKGKVDDYCNMANLIFAKIINLLASSFGRNNVDLGESVAALWDEMQDWYRLRPPDVHPLLRQDPSPGSVLPTILHARTSAICGNTYYHAGSILLLQTGAVQITPDAPRNTQADAIWHARELTGISTCNPSQSPAPASRKYRHVDQKAYSANWVNHLQPLYIAGTVFAGYCTTSPPSKHGQSQDVPSYQSAAQQPGSPDLLSLPGIGDRLAQESTMAEEYASEKIFLLKHLSRIEAETGWKTSDRAAELRGLWGLG
ncbi:hypothetical protein BO99DRAFT_469894 [Aspergillus violaceofuscus CBS 115571]|uniref:Uncharacterized protein n=1 Tax=Aspergillus violaceofuscus (strain CBS 115571) TaxID=1450538 RepID=A0A2V5I8E1_ASPV1|nr:hypothetical protein BO99DRAFT_469894 [Aspergillus violaceofuscus CBS 115571]